MKFRKFKFTFAFAIIFILCAKKSFAVKRVISSKNLEEAEIILDEDYKKEEGEIEEKDEEKEIEELPKIKIKDVDKENFTDSVILQGLNKITAKTFPLEGKMNEAITFERLTIKPLKCWKAPQTQKPENKILLKVYEKQINSKEEKLIFYGWMFSSSPSLSGLEHPTYDVTIVECKANKENQTNK